MKNHSNQGARIKINHSPSKDSLFIRHPINKRSDASWVLFQILENGRSASEVMPIIWARHEKPQDRAWLQEMVYGCLRNLPELQVWLRQLLNKPLKKQQKIIEHLLMLGLYQLAYSRTAEHAAVSETVDACKQMKEIALSGLVNAVLRRFQREDIQSQVHTQPHVTLGLPKWLYKALLAHYGSENGPENGSENGPANSSENSSKNGPDQSATEGEDGNANHGVNDALNTNGVHDITELAKQMHTRAPLWLRVNTQSTTMANFEAQLSEAQYSFESFASNSAANNNAANNSFASNTIKLINAGEIMNLPGFEEGHFAVQDLAAQQAALLLDAQAGDIILDCCAAPGGKSAGILEYEPQLAHLYILDADAKRMNRVHENFARLGHDNTFKEQVTYVVQDASVLSENTSLPQFDRILLDAPCSATGVIRRHPDIMWLRKPADINVLVDLQKQILHSAWQKLKSGGVLVYATCSILPQENQQQIEDFIATHNDATLVPVKTNKNVMVNTWQILPGQDGMDGFFYAKLSKR